MPDQWNTDGDGINERVSMFALRNPLYVDPNGAAVTPSVVYCEADPYGPWLVTIDQPHHQVHEGETFTFMEVVTLASGGVQDYLLTVPAGKYPNVEYNVEGTYGITVEVYEATGKTQSASAVTAYNRNRNSLKVPGMTIKKGTDGGSGDGTRIVWKKNGTGTSAGRVSGTGSSRAERVWKASTAYIVRVTSAAASNDVNVWLSWYEEGATVA